MSSRRVEVGRIAGVFGVKGWVKIHSFTEPPANILKYQPWILVDATGERSVDKPRGNVQGQNITALLPGCEDRETAQGLIGTRILVERSALPAPKPDEYYWTDLEGLRVVNKAGVELGLVSHLFSTPANDVLVVKGDREHLLPWLPGVYVLKVDLDARLIEVDWDETF